MGTLTGLEKAAHLEDETHPSWSGYGLHLMRMDVKCREGCCWKMGELKKYNCGVNSFYLFFSMIFSLGSRFTLKPALKLTSYMTVSLPVFPELLWRFQKLFHRKPLAQCLKYGKSLLRVSWKLNCIINNPSFPLISLKPWAFHAWLKLFCLLRGPETSQIV